MKGPLPPTRRFVQFGPPGARAVVVQNEQRVEQAKPEPKPLAKPAAKIDPKLVAAARELRDRWLEKVNEEPALLTSVGKYDVARALAAGGPDVNKALPPIAA